MDSLKEIFSFSRAETIALSLLLTVCLLGGGILVYQHSRQTLPPQLIFDSIPSTHNALPETPPDNKPPTSMALDSDLASKPQPGKEQRKLRLNINSAPAESLVLLPFVGETLSARIIAYRQKHGPFDSTGQLVEVYGIGPKNLEKIRPYLFCE